MSTASISRPLRVNVRMRPTDVLPPMLQRTSTLCLAGSGVRARKVALARLHPGDGRFTPPFPLWWALEPSRSGVFFLKVRSDEPSHGHPVAPRRAPPCFHTEPSQPGAEVVSAKPHVNGTRPTSTQMPSACKGPSPGRPPGGSFAAAPGVLMRFAPPAVSPASLGPCPCGQLMADRHPRGPRTTCQRLQPNTTHEHTRDLPNLSHGREDSGSLSCHMSNPPAIPE